MTLASLATNSVQLHSEPEAHMVYEKIGYHKDTFKVKILKRFDDKS